MLRPALLPVPPVRTCAFARDLVTQLWHCRAGAHHPSSETSSPSSMLRSQTPSPSSSSCSPLLPSRALCMHASSSSAPSPALADRRIDASVRLVWLFIRKHDAQLQELMLAGSMLFHCTSRKQAECTGFLLDAGSSLTIWVHAIGHQLRIYVAARQQKFRPAVWQTFGGTRHICAASTQAREASAGPCSDLQVTACRPRSQHSLHSGPATGLVPAPADLCTPGEASTGVPRMPPSPRLPLR